ncbi:hypothetical protein L6R29_21295, partial [Myxococcota bacterium]|nr:hypothetical protein [Myxococcota bacterium]
VKSVSISVDAVCCKRPVIGQPHLSAPTFSRTSRTELVETVCFEKSSLQSEQSGAETSLRREKTVVLSAKRID